MQRDFVYAKESKSLSLILSSLNSSFYYILILTVVVSFGFQSRYVFEKKAKM